MFGRREVFSGCHSNLYHQTSRPPCEGSVLHAHGVHNGGVAAQRRAKQTGERQLRGCRSVVEIERSAGVGVQLDMYLADDSAQGFLKISHSRSSTQMLTNS